MTRRRLTVLVASATALGLVALWRIATGDDRRLDGQVRQALERYEQAFARDGARATPTPARRDGFAPVLGAPSVEKVTVLRDGGTLTAEFIGGRATGPCGSDYTARAVESEHAVLIVIEEHPHWRVRACTSEGHLRQATVRLSRPLDGRTVLEAMRGMPVTVEPAG
ncbi:hypothetical protein ACLQ2R_36205 [Streptosporangium sp. DT93]|uniref:hypothetical protein n=1 Tax=Streptosporangium sp. DT93 TaxID=3393428 RepID=UPI003CF02B08